MEPFVADARRAKIVDEVRLPANAARALRTYATLRKRAEDEERRSAKAASAQDINAMARWTSLKVVHYRADGEFSGPIDEGGISARVIDSVDIEFDWD